MRLAGIIYLHDISKDRVIQAASRNLHKNLAVFKQFSGDNPLQRFVLATTKWGRLVDERLGPKRETELREGFWRVMLRRGSPITQFRDTLESAQNIVSNILKIQEPIDVDLRKQTEFVALQKSSKRDMTPRRRKLASGLARLDNIRQDVSVVKGASELDDIVL